MFRPDWLEGGHTLTKAVIIKRELGYHILWVRRWAKTFYAHYLI
jgi:hypothetical protein